VWIKRRIVANWNNRIKSVRRINSKPSKKTDGQGGIHG